MTDVAPIKQSSKRRDEVMLLIRSNNLSAAEALCLQPGYVDDDGTLQYVRALIARKNRDWDEVLLHLEYALHCSPTNSDYLDEKGYALYQQGRSADAARIYTAILVDHPQHINALNNLAVIYSEQHRLTEAEELLHRSLAIEPQQVTAWLNLCSAVETQAAREQDAVHYAEQAVRLAPTDSRPYLYLCKALLRQGYPTKALEVISQAAAIDPRNADIHYRIGLCHMQLEDYQSAAQAFELALAINPRHSDTFHALSELFFSLNDLAAAEEACLQAIASSSSQAIYPELLAKILFAQDRYQEAENTYNTAQELRTRQNKPAQPIRTLCDVRSAEQWANDNGSPPVETLPAQEWEVAPPLFFGHTSDAQSAQVKIPHAYFTQLKNTLVFPRREVILVNDQKTAIYNCLAALRRGDSISKDDSLPFAANNTLTIADLSISQKTIDTGIYMLSDSSQNYAHWVTEVLTRFHAIDQANLPEQIPLLVNDHLYPQQIDSLQALAGKQRPIIPLSSASLHRVDHLYFPSTPISYFQNKLGPGKSPAPTEATFQPAAIAHFRSKLLEQFAATESKLRRLWISRKNQTKYRRFLNEEEIETIFCAHGFELVYPEKMSFAEQVRTFSTAEMIAGGTGAGMANMVFAPPGAKILLFTVYHPHINYNYFNNLAKINRQELAYVVGDLLKNFALRGYEYQSDFTVPTALATSAIANFLAR